MICLNIRQLNHSLFRSFPMPALYAHALRMTGAISGGDEHTNKAPLPKGPHCSQCGLYGHISEYRLHYFARAHD